MIVSNGNTQEYLSAIKKSGEDTLFSFLHNLKMYFVDIVHLLIFLLNKYV
jgi:hypothetical protein